MKLRKHELHGASNNDYDIDEIVCIHIDYANRPESATEADFVEKWCKNNAYVHTVGGCGRIVFRKRILNEVTRGITDRSEYETVSREIRYSYYKGGTIYLLSFLVIL